MEPSDQPSSRNRTHPLAQAIVRRSSDNDETSLRDETPPLGIAHLMGGMVCVAVMFGVLRVLGREGDLVGIRQGSAWLLYGLGHAAAFWGITLKTIWRMRGRDVWYLPGDFLLLLETTETAFSLILFGIWRFREPLEVGSVLFVFFFGYLLVMAVVQLSILIAAARRTEDRRWRIVFWIGCTSVVLGFPFCLGGVPRFVLLCLTTQAAAVAFAVWGDIVSRRFYSWTHWLGVGVFAWTNGLWIAQLVWQWSKTW